MQQHVFWHVLKLAVENYFANMGVFGYQTGFPLKKKKKKNRKMAQEGKMKNLMTTDQCEERHRGI